MNSTRLFWNVLSNFNCDAMRCNLLRANVCVCDVIHFCDMVWFLKFAFAFKFSLNGISFRCFWFDFLLIFYSNENSGEHCKYIQGDVTYIFHLFGNSCFSISISVSVLAFRIPYPMLASTTMMYAMWCSSLRRRRICYFCCWTLYMVLHQFYLLCILSIPTHSIWMSVNQIESTNC